MSLPTWVDIEFSEQAAASMARRLSGSYAAWGTLLANAQAILGYRTDTVHSEQQESYDFDEWRDLVAAARILDLAATRLGVGDSDDRKTAAILAACAFGMSGTAVSAAAVIRSHRLLDSDLSPGELMALAISSPALSREVFLKLPAGSIQRTCIENVTTFLASGDESQLGAAAEGLERAIREEPNPWDGYLLRLSRLCLAHAGRLSVAKVLGIL